MVVIGGFTANVVIFVVLNLWCFPEAVLMCPFIDNVKMKYFLRLATEWVQTTSLESSEPS